MGLKERLFGNKPRIEKMKNDSTELVKIKHLKNFSQNSYIYIAQKRTNGRKEGNVIFGLPKDISEFRGDYGIDPIMTLTSRDIRSLNGPIYLGTIGEGKDYLFYRDETGEGLFLDPANYHLRKQIAKDFNSRMFETAKTRINIKSTPRVDFQYEEGKTSYTINDMKTGLLIKLKDIQAMENIERGENLLYSANLSYKHVNDNVSTQPRRVAFELYTAIEFIDTIHEEEMLGKFFSKSSVQLDRNQRHVTYLGNLHKSGDVTRTKKVAEGIKRLNKKIDRNAISPTVKVSTPQPRMVQESQDSEIPTDTERQ